ncbi:hypothetical protein BDN70DRAFT_876704 [Pholiota conissans]|uniref:Uncharacterized protein n=1 Tax=Pholiota conissans TaxID=109636 RepID=A0A9P6D2W9_9AGAR|nr:hypothetical protein BDN70DRAFT_876704 [Pholiota conissans]
MLGETPSQTTEESAPIGLNTDLNDFRALCWFIYALSTVHMEQYTLATANIEKLVSLYLISHEYRLDSHHKFAGDILRKHCITLEAKASSKPKYFTKCPQARLSKLLKVAASKEILSTVLGKTTSFSTVLQKFWIARLKKTKESICYALKVGEQLGLRNFLAGLYYLELTRITPVLMSKSSIAYNHPANQDLDPDAKLALYQGYWSLQNHWSATHKKISQEEFRGCMRRHDCRQLWKRGWEEIKSTRTCPMPFDPLQELTDIKNEITKLEAKRDTRGPCALRLVEVMVDELKGSFADHFLGPLSD